MKTKIIIPVILIIFIAMISGTVAYYGHNSHNRNIISSLGYSTSFNDGWYILDGQNEKKIKTEWISYYADDNGTVSIYSRLPASSDVSSNTLALRTGYIAFDAFLNDVQCYSYGMHVSGPQLSTNPGWRWHFIEIPPSANGGIIRLDIKSFYFDGSESITDAYYGKSAVILRDIIAKNLPGFSLCILLILVGLAYMIMHIVFNYLMKIKTHLFYIGLFIMLTASWSVTNTSILMFFIKDVSAINLLESILLLVIPLALQLYVEHTCTIKYRKLFISSYIVTIANFLIQFAISVWGTLDFHAMVNTAYLAIFYSAAVMVFTLYDSRAEYMKENDNSFYVSAVFYSLVVFCIAALIDTIHVSISAVSDGSVCMRVALVALATSTGAKSLYEASDFARQNYISETVRGLAYTDALTQLGNRTSFTDTLSETELSKRKHKTLAVFIFDVNYLKYVNDNFGHQQGDKLIISCADMIKEIFTDDCRLFRIGGDEFAAVYSGELSSDTLRSRITTFNDAVAQYNYEHRGPFELSVAVGVAFMNSSRTETMDELFKRADRIMYDNKKAMKQQSNIITR